MAGLNSDVDKFLTVCGVLILGCFTAVSLGTAIAVSAPNLNIALAITPSILIPMMIFSGFFLNNELVIHYKKSEIKLIKLFNI